MIIPTFFMERAPMLRERASRFYAVFPWVRALVCYAPGAMQRCLGRFASHRRLVYGRWLSAHAACTRVCLTSGASHRPVEAMPMCFACAPLLRAVQKPSSLGLR